MAAIKDTSRTSAESALPDHLPGRQITIQQAVDYCTAVRNARMPKERVPLNLALERVVRENVLSQNPVPPFSKSLVDGYAIKYPDENGVSDSCAVCLRVKGRMAAGDMPGARLSPGEAVRIMTGAPIPAGTDRVVKNEDVTNSGASVFIRSGDAKNPFILQAGADVQKNSLILSAGAVVKPADIAMMAACGCKSLRVSIKPNIGIVSIGNEISPAVCNPNPGQSWDVIGPLVSALSQKAGATAGAVLNAADNIDEIMAAVMRLSHCDLIILIGGMANGDFDLTRAALKTLGIQNRLAGIEVQSTRRVFYGDFNSRPVWALSGPAAAVMTNFLLLIRPVIDYILGKSVCGLRTGVLPLLTNLQVSGRNKQFLPGVLNWHDGQTRVMLFDEQRFGYFTPMQAADVLVELPPDQSEFNAGHRVKVYYIE